ncbi:MAG: hypothetical protein QW343_00255 [Candidatus Norongarragalinales archaeon]
MKKPRIVRVKEKPLKEREPPSERDFEFKEIFLPRVAKKKK